MRIEIYGRPILTTKGNFFSILLTKLTLLIKCAFYFVAAKYSRYILIVLFVCCNCEKKNGNMHVLSVTHKYMTILLFAGLASAINGLRHENFFKDKFL